MRKFQLELSGEMSKDEWKKKPSFKVSASTEQVNIFLCERLPFPMVKHGERAKLYLRERLPLRIEMNAVSRSTEQEKQFCVARYAIQWEQC